MLQASIDDCKVDVSPLIAEVRAVPSKINVEGSPVVEVMRQVQLDLKASDQMRHKSEEHSDEKRNLEFLTTYSALQDLTAKVQKLADANASLMSDIATRRTHPEACKHL